MVPDKKVTINNPNAIKARDAAHSYDRSYFPRTWNLEKLCAITKIDPSQANQPTRLLALATNRRRRCSLNNAKERILNWISGYLRDLYGGGWLQFLRSFDRKQWRKLDTQIGI